MERRVVGFLALFGVWLLWSGHTEPLMLAFGVASSAFVVWLSGRLDLPEVLPSGRFALRLALYVPWLLLQIARSNLAVARIVLSRGLPISPRLVRIRATSRTALGQVVLANSITLTPGTITLDLRDDTLLVHALTAESARDLETGEMDRRVARLEGVADV